MALTAQDIIELAKKQNRGIARDGCLHDKDQCARRIVANEINTEVSMYMDVVVNGVWEKFGLTWEDQVALEQGFEDFSEYYFNPYYKVGQEVYRLTQP